MSIESNKQEILVVTGMSGAGRSTVANALEDLGWYVVDNLPLTMLPTLADMAAKSSSVLPKIAVVIDIRGNQQFEKIQDTIGTLKKTSTVRIIFLDATDDVLVQRYESVRRPHPLQKEGTLSQGITLEREMMRELRASSDVVIDTSRFNVHDLSTTTRQMFSDEDTPGLRLTVQSFGFKYGTPNDADLIADMRFIPNPFWKEELRALTGADSPVRDYVLQQQGVEEFLDYYVKALTVVFEGFQRENKRHAALAVGCTGGKHRSVAVSRELADRLAKIPGINVSVSHRDLGRE